MKNRSLLLNVVLGVVGIAALLLGVILFLQYELTSLKDEILTLEEKQITTQNQKNNVFAVKNILEDTKDDRKRIDEYFIEGEREVVGLLEDLETLGEPFGLISTVSIDENNGGEEISSLALDVSVTGSFNEVYTYLVLLEHFPAKTSFKSMNLRVLRDGPGPGEPKWSLRVLVDIESYRKKNKESVVTDKTKYKKHRHVGRDWTALLVFFFLLLVGISIAGVIVYQRFVVRTDDIVEVEKQETLNKEQLNEVITIINEREEVFNQHRSTTTSLTDPSL